MAAKLAPLARDVAFDHRLEPHVRVHHALAGRTRLRLEPLHGRADLLGALARRVAARERIRDVVESPWSSSLLVVHEKELSAEDVANLVREIWRRGPDGASRRRAG